MSHSFLLVVVGLFALLLASTSALRFSRYQEVLNNKRALSSTAYWLDQKVDHFDPFNSKTFKQKYYFSDTYWDGKGPALLYISGEGPCNGVPNNEVMQYAKDLKAIVFTLEHRYYGESQPFDSLATENLRYLTSRQAIEDLATFIRFIQASQLSGKSTKWICIGGSYAGALSAWFRDKHPELVVGAISSSGVVHAIADFYEYDEQVSVSVGPECAEKMRLVSEQIEFEMGKGFVSAQHIKGLFNASFLDDSDFYCLIGDAGAAAVQYGNQKIVCDAVSVPDNQLIEAYANYTVNWFYPSFGGPEQYSIAELRKTSPPTASRSWWFQTCVEFGWFQTAPKNDSIRPKNVDVEYFRECCLGIFERELWPNVNETNTYYGGLSIAASNIFFINSSQDPWQRASLLSAIYPGQSTFMITCNNCGHCTDLSGCPGGCTSPESLATARSESVDLMTQWIADSP